MRVELSSQVAMIAGGADGLAAALAAVLKANGSHVAGEPGLEFAAAQAAPAVERALGAFGRLDMLVLISNCAVRWETEYGVATVTESETAGPAVLDAYCQATHDSLAATGGRIVVIASALGLVPARFDPAAGAYAARLFFMVRALAMRLGPAGVRINGLAVGALARAGQDGRHTNSNSRLLSHAPLGRPGGLHGLAEAAAFLLDPENSYLNGHVLAFDGGWAAGYARDF